MKRRINAVRISVEEREKRRKRMSHDSESESEEEEDEQRQLDQIERKLRQHEAWMEKDREAQRKEEERKRREREEDDEEDQKPFVETVIVPLPAEPKTFGYKDRKKKNVDAMNNPNNCDFYMRTGVCRFGKDCKRLHPRVEVSTNVLIPSMFEHPTFQEFLDKPENEGSSPSEELVNAFNEFFEDTLPEFRKIGEVKQFKVCFNHAKHLRGNVYVSYDKEEEAFVAAQVFGGRFYAGRRLEAHITIVRSWRNAICRDYGANICSKGRSCNFLHCFANPNGEFADADKDFGAGDEEEEEKRKRKEEKEEERLRRRALQSRGRRKRTPSPPGKHRPFRSRDHYVEDERIWSKKRKEVETREAKWKEEIEEERRKKWEEEREEEEQRMAEKRKKKKKVRAYENELCEGAMKAMKRKKERRSRSRGRSSSDSRSSSSHSSEGGSSSDEVNKKILKATLKSIKSGKKAKKKKSKKSKKKKSKKSKDAGDTTDSDWDSDASGGG